MSFKKITAEDISFIEALFGKEYVTVHEEISDDYSRDEMTPEAMRSMPELLVKATTTGQVSKLLAFATRENIPVTPRGQGTGLVMGSVSIHGGIMLDLTAMNRILELDRENLTMTVEPGALIMEIRAFAEEHDLFYPPMPGEQSASIGGNIATNAGGMKAVKYGVTRDYVRGLEIVLPTGEVLELGGKIAKNSSGYSLKDLIIGSEGTLAVVTKAILRLLPLPKKVVSLLVPFNDPVTAIKAVPRILGGKIIPVAVEFMEGDVIVAAENYLGKRFPDHSASAYLLLSIDGKDKKGVEMDYEEIARLCLDCGAIDVFISDTQERQDALWSARGAFLEGIKASTTEMDECDVVVPISKIPAFLEFKQQLERKMAVRIPSFAHAGDGNLHVYILRDALGEEVWKQKLEDSMSLLYAKAKELGGQISGEHGVGFLKKDFLLDSIGPIAVRLMQGIKQAFDPRGILNPGKII
ncbi:MAG: FAD-binding oxidoreductase [Promethearchaeota archaeon]